jgi:hypothetical protein
LLALLLADFLMKMLSPSSSSSSSSTKVGVFFCYHLRGSELVSVPFAGTLNNEVIRLALVSLGWSIVVGYIWTVF